MGLTDLTGGQRDKDVPGGWVLDPSGPILPEGLDFSLLHVLGFLGKAGRGGASRALWGSPGLRLLWIQTCERRGSQLPLKQKLCEGRACPAQGLSQGCRCTYVMNEVVGRAFGPNPVSSDRLEERPREPCL